METTDDVGTKISGSYPLTGPAEVVFSVLTDPDRVARWLSGVVRVESVSTGRIELRTGDRVDGYRVETSPEDLRVRWRSENGHGGYGTAQVKDAPAGGSVLSVEATLPDSAGDRETVDGLLDEAARGLQSEVSDNFNAG